MTASTLARIAQTTRDAAYEQAITWLTEAAMVDEHAHRYESAATYRNAASVIALRASNETPIAEARFQAHAPADAWGRAR